MIFARSDRISFATSLEQFDLPCIETVGRYHDLYFSRLHARRDDRTGGCVATINSNGQTIWIADAHRDDGRRFVVRADEKLTAFLELESAIGKNSVDTVCQRLAVSRSR